MDESTVVVGVVVATPLFPSLMSGLVVMLTFLLVVAVVLVMVLAVAAVVALRLSLRLSLVIPAFDLVAVVEALATVVIGGDVFVGVDATVVVFDEVIDDVVDDVVFEVGGGSTIGMNKLGNIAGTHRAASDDVVFVFVDGTGSTPIDVPLAPLAAAASAGTIDGFVVSGSAFAFNPGTLVLYSFSAAFTGLSRRSRARDDDTDGSRARDDDTDGDCECDFGGGCDCCCSCGSTSK